MISPGEGKERDLLRSGSQELYRALCDNIPLPAVISRLSDGQMLYWNAAFSEFIGAESFPISAMAGRSFFAEPAKREEVTALLRARGKLTNYRFSGVTPSGRKFVALLTMQLISYGADEAICEILNDITADARAEQEMARREEFHEALLNDMLTFVGILKTDGEIVFINNTPLKVGGLDLADIKGMKFYDAGWWTHCEEVRQMVMEDVARCAEGETLVHDVQIRTADGSLMWIEYSMHPVRDEHGSVSFLIPEGRDITRRRKAEQEIIEKERFQEALLNDMLTFVGILKTDGEIVFINNTPLNVGGMDLADIKGMKFYDAGWWTHRDEVRQMVIEDVARCAEGETLVHDVPIRIADGSLMWIEYSMHPVTDRKGKVVYLIPEGRDITERVAAEAAAAETSRLVEVARLQERELLSRDLHDGVCQLVTGVKFHISSLSKEVTALLPQLDDRFTRILDLLEDISRDTRNVMKGLQPVDIHPESLWLALEKLAEETEIRSSIRCRLIEGERVLVSNRPVANNLFLIAKEAVMNACKHSECTTILVKLVTTSGGGITLCVSDDGEGFDPVSPSRRGYGLEIMKYRADQVGAELEIEQGQDTGCCVTVTWRP